MTASNNTNYLETYPNVFARLKAALGDEQAVQAAVGGDFEAVGKIERDLLALLGLADNAFVVDVGCGSGRLAVQLAERPGIRFLGTDILPELLSHAEKICRRPDWRFERTQGVGIPLEDNQADFVCFFSVFTHLTHEDSYRYLLEAARVAKPGAKIVFSFLEFHIRSHWTVFETSLLHAKPGDHLNQFMSRDGIEAWALNAGLEVECIMDGDQANIPLREPVRWQDGREMTNAAALGQSIAVLRKPGEA